MLDYIIEITQHIPSRNARNLQTLRAQPGVSHGVAVRRVSALMRFTVNFDCQSCLRTKEIQDIRPGGMLASEFVSRRPPSQFLPHQHFRQRHRPAQLSGAFLGRFRAVEH